MNEVVVTHIEPGETLSEIAFRYGVSVDALQKWNRIENPDLVLVGQRIVVYKVDSPQSPISEGVISPPGSGLDVVGDSWDAWIGGAIALVFLLLLFRVFRSGRSTLVGRAYVTDGDGIRVSGQEVRFSGLDAPEWDQVAKHRDGYWFRHGRRVKSALIREIGGRRVHVAVEDYDKFGRAIGIVTCGSKDIGEWLVREGHARALYSDRYKQTEKEARDARRGMWGHAVNIDPRQWRHRKPSWD